MMIKNLLINYKKYCLSNHNLLIGQFKKIKRNHGGHLKVRFIVFESGTKSFIPLNKSVQLFNCECLDVQIGFVDFIRNFLPNLIDDMLNKPLVITEAVGITKIIADIMS